MFLACKRFAWGCLQESRALEMAAIWIYHTEVNSDQNSDQQLTVCISREWQHNESAPAPLKHENRKPWSTFDCCHSSVFELPMAGQALLSVVPRTHVDGAEGEDGQDQHEWNHCPIQFYLQVPSSTPHLRLDVHVPNSDLPQLQKVLQLSWADEQPQLINTCVSSTSLLPQQLELAPSYQTMQTKLSGAATATNKLELADPVDIVFSYQTASSTDAKGGENFMLKLTSALQATGRTTFNGLQVVSLSHSNRS